MESIQLLKTTPANDLTSLSDADLEAFFADAGMLVEVVTHCDDAACPSCFSREPAKAA